MSSENSDGRVVVGSSFTSLLTLLFITLKLTGYINWSWWWVLSPTLISVVLFIAIVALVVWLNR